MGCPVVPVSEDSNSRKLTEEEHDLVRRMLEKGGESARTFLAHLERVRVSPKRCPCGCASLEFSVDGLRELPGELRPIVDFVFGEGDELSGIFAYERSGFLAGLEVYGLAGDAPRHLPRADTLKPVRWGKGYE